METGKGIFMEKEQDHRDLLPSLLGQCEQD